MYYRISLTTGKEHIVHVGSQYQGKLESLMINSQRTLITMEKVISEGQFTTLKVWNDHIVSIEEVAIC